jgi:hypothetical protein
MEWDITFYRNTDDNIPADDFLDDCPVNVRARLMAILDAVAEAPPPQFSGGGSGKQCTQIWAGTMRFVHKA